VLWYRPYEGGERRWVGRREEVEIRFDLVEPVAIPTFEPPSFEFNVRSIREAIAAGDVYQVNLTYRVPVPRIGADRLLAALCRHGVPRFACWLNVAPELEFVSASPELLFESDGTRIRVEPMKGTAAAGCGQELLQSQKDRAELAMITDLLRDDLNHLCEPRSVVVENERRLIELPYVVQSVADVHGRAREGVTLEEMLNQLHPGGSVTGTPRIAACELISKLEETPRDAYCGTLGFQRGDAARFSLLIRTTQRQFDGTWRFGVGGGITWDSTVEGERAELELKLGAFS
jgi:para-aminobenzoate synthetase/4-amino-4-deoxychorismate lyase